MSTSPVTPQIDLSSGFVPKQTQRIDLSAGMVPIDQSAESSAPATPTSPTPQPRPVLAHAGEPLRMSHPEYGDKDVPRSDVGTWAKLGWTVSGKATGASPNIIRDVDEVPGESTSTGNSLIEGAQAMREEMAGKGAQLGRNLADTIVNSPASAPEFVTPMTPEEREQATAKHRTEHPILTGVAKSIGGTVGGVAADPLTYAAAGAGNSRLVSGAFGAQMATDTAENIGKVKEILDNPDLPKDEKVEAVSNVIVSALMAAVSIKHAVAQGKTIPKPEIPQETLEAIPEKDRAAVQAAVEKKLQAQTEATTASPIDLSTGFVKSESPKATTKAQRYKLPENQAVATVDKPVAGPNVRSVEVDGQHYAFDPRKTNAQQVKAAVASGELWKLTGEKPPIEAQDQALTDVRGEQPAVNINAGLVEKPQPAREIESRENVVDNGKQLVTPEAKQAQESAVASQRQPQQFRVVRKGEDGKNYVWEGDHLIGPSVFSGEPVRRDPVTNLSNVRYPEEGQQAKDSTADVASVRLSDLTKELRDAESTGDTKAQQELKLAIDRERAFAENKPFDIHEQIEAHPDLEVQAYLKGIYGERPAPAELGETQPTTEDRSGQADREGSGARREFSQAGASEAGNRAPEEQPVTPPEGYQLEGQPRPEAAVKGKPSERGSSPMSGLPIPALVESVSGAAEKASNWYHGKVDKLLEWAHMGNTRPEIRQFDPNAADLATKMDAGGQYHKAVAKMIGEKVTGPLTEKFEKNDSPAQIKAKNETSHDLMKGFHFMADEQNRAWLKESRPTEYERWSNDPKIQQAVEAYKPYQDDLRAAVKQLGGNVINEDYIKRVIDFTTSGIDHKVAPGEGGGAGRDAIVSPQTAKSKSRTDAGQFYWDHGVFDFGPSFEKRWVEVMSKLDEHRLAVHSMSMGTRIMPDEAAPDKIFYNGQEFYRPDIANEIRDVQRRGVSSESKALANALGVTELPTPGKVRQYWFYEPLAKGSRFENSARGLAKSVLDSEGRASGTKLTEADRDVQIAQARNLLNMQKMKYALPKEIVSALEDAGREKELGALAQKVSKVLGPITQFVRQQLVGLAYGIPHMANIMRKVMQSHPGAALNPAGWADAFKVAFSKELQARGIRGTADPAYDMLLKNAAISEAAIPDYKHYIEGNFNPRNWGGAKEATATVGNAFRKGGKAGADVTPLSVAAGPVRLVIEPLNRFSEAGHNNLFKQGGIDQRARIWLHDFMKDRSPKMPEEEIAYRVNQTLGRYNRASWTDIQRNLGPFMMFPGWDYSSATYALRHPFKTAVAPALLMLMANTAVNLAGGNKKEDSKDLEHVHLGKYQVRTNLLNDNMGSHLFGWALRAGTAGLQHKSVKAATGEAARGLPGDVAGISTGLLNPILSAGASLTYDRMRPGSTQEIAPRGDVNRPGKILPSRAAEDYTMFGTRHLFPILDRISPQGQRPSPLSLGGLAGVSITEPKKKRR